MKKYLISLLALAPASLYAGTITHSDYVAGQTITAAAQNTNENAIVNEINGNIDSANIKNASIATEDIAVGAIVNSVIAVSSVTADRIQGSATAPQVLRSSSVALGAYWGYPSIVQISSYSVTGASVSVAGNFVPTNLTMSIIPRSANNKVLVLATFTANTGAVSTVAYYGLTRNSTTLGGSDGFVLLTSGSATAAPAHITYLDSPNSTSSVTYTVTMRTGGSGTISLNVSGQSPSATIYLIEVAW